jgi:hypothetical protein
MVRRLPDDTFYAAILQKVDDAFWSAYDDVRRRAIASLADSLVIDRR